MRIRLLSLVAAGLFGSAAGALAQSAPSINQSPYKAYEPQAAAPAQLSPVVRTGAIQPAQATAAAPCNQPVVVSGQGCSSCSQPVGPRISLLGSLRIGQGCAMPIGCSNTAAERTFFFGSCRQFFNPGNDCGRNSGLLGPCGVGPCNTGASAFCNGGCYGAPQVGPMVSSSSYLQR